MTADTIRRMVTSLEPWFGFILLDSQADLDRARGFVRRLGGKCRTKKTREGWMLWRTA